MIGRWIDSMASCVLVRSAIWQHLSIFGNDIKNNLIQPLLPMLLFSLCLANHSQTLLPTSLMVCRTSPSFPA